MSNDTLGPARLVGGQLGAVVPDAKRDDEAALARRRIASARRPAAGRRAPIDDGVSRASCRSRCCRASFSDDDDTIAQTDIVMLLTPRIIRTHEYTARDLSPIYVGTNQNFGLTGPPPLIAAPPVEPETHRRPAPPRPRRRAAAGAARADRATGRHARAGDDTARRRRRCTAGAARSRSRRRSAGAARSHGAADRRRSRRRRRSR